MYTSIIAILFLYSVPSYGMAGPVDALPQPHRPCQLNKQTDIVYRCHYRAAGDAFRTASSSSLTGCDDVQPSGSVVYTMCKDLESVLSHQELMRCDDGVWNYEAKCQPAA